MKLVRALINGKRAQSFADIAKSAELSFDADVLAGDLVAIGDELYLASKNDRGVMFEPMGDASASPSFLRLVGMLPLLEGPAAGAPDSELIRRLFAVAHVDGCVLNWPEWSSYTGQVRLYEVGPELGRADLFVCRRLLTIIVRPALYWERDLARHIESGFAARLVRRIGTLVRLHYPPPGMIDAAADMLHDMEREELAEFLARPRPPCSACSSELVVPIVLGEPTGAAEEAARRGDVVLGGCQVHDDAPVWACRSCQHEFGRFADGVREEKEDAETSKG